MSLLAYNLTTAPLPLAAGVPIATLPASASAGSRGPALNVTGELKGQLAPAFALLQAQVAAGNVQYEWTGLPEFDVFTLLVGSAQEDVDDLDVAIYVATTGSDANPGTNPLQPLLTFEEAMRRVPAAGWRKSCVIYLAPGVYVEGGLGGMTLSSNHPPGGGELHVIGSFTNELGNRTTTAASAGGVLVVDGSLAMTPDQYFGNFIEFLPPSLNAGQQRGIRKNTATDIEVNDPFPNPIAIGDQFVIQKPAVEIQTPFFQLYNMSWVCEGIKFSLGGGNMFLSGSVHTRMTGCEIDMQGGFFGMNYGSTFLGADFENFNHFSAGVTIRNCGLEVGTGSHFDLYFMFDGVYYSGNLGDSQFQAVTARNTQFNIEGASTVNMWGSSGAYPGQIRDSFGSAVVLGPGASMRTDNVDISNSNGDAILVGDNSTAVISSISGTLNAGVGIHVQRRSNATINYWGGTTTVTGVLGDTEFGNTAVPNRRTYAAINTPDGNGVKAYSDTYGNHIESYS